MIIIISCAKDTHWYNNRIGEEFEIDMEIEDVYKVFNVK
jgi:hypothetical protein